MNPKMKQLKRSAVLAMVAALPLSVTANVAPITSSASAAVDCLSGLEGYISNPGDVGVGVIKAWRGEHYPYANGLYDNILMPGKRTDCDLRWVRAQGYYVGPGYCAYLSKWNGSRWVYNHNSGHGQWALPHIAGQSVQRWEVRAYPRNCY